MTFAVHFSLITIFLSCGLIDYIIMLRGKDRIKSLYKESQLAGSYPARVKRPFSYVLVHRTEASFLEQFTRQRSLSKAIWIWLAGPGGFYRSYMLSKLLRLIGPRR